MKETDWQHLMKETDWQHFYYSSLDRMIRLIAAKAPPALMVNECRTMMRNAERGAWRAMRRWAWDEIQCEASNCWFEVRVFMYSTFCGLSRNTAIDKILDIDQRREELRWEKKGRKQ